MYSELLPSEVVTPVKGPQPRRDSNTPLRRSQLAKHASDARWYRHKHLRSPRTPHCVPSLGPRPPRGPKLREWRAGRAQLMGYEATLTTLRQVRDDELGRPWTKETAINIIETVINLMVLFNLSKTIACEMVATSWHRRKKKVLDVVNAWMGKREVLWDPPRLPGAASSSYPHFCASLDSTHQLLIISYMKEVNDQGQVVTAPLLRTYLRDKCNVEVSLRRLRDYLTDWGCTYDRVVEVCPVDKEWHARRIAKFIVNYAEALKLEENGMHVIVYMDESYIHNNHALQKGWFPPGSDRHVRRPKRAGRFVIFHAITKDGLLLKERSARDGDLTHMTVNTEYVYHIDTRPRAKDAAESASNVTDVKDDKDAYHGNIDANMFLLWLQNRLIPSFRAKYPGKKMILVMDNASYHNPHEDGWVPVSAMRKEQLVAALKRYNITSFTATRERTGEGGQVLAEAVTFDEASFSLDKRRDDWPRRPVPGVDEMKKFLSAWLKQHPELVLTRTRRLMQELGWQIVFTPPLEARCQPIEQLWAQVKGLVAQLYVLGRSMELTREHLMLAFYEHHYQEKVEDDQHLGNGVTARHCRRMIQHSHDWMEAFIKKHPHLLAGTLKRLTFKNDLALSSLSSVDEDEMEDAAIVDEEARLQSQEDWHEAELLAAQGLFQLDAAWGYVGPADEEPVPEDGDGLTVPRESPAITAAPILSVDAAGPCRLRPVVTTSRALTFGVFV